MAAEVYTDVHAALQDVRYRDITNSIDKQDKQYFEYHMSGISSTREAMTSASFCPEVVQGIWTDLINTPIEAADNPADITE